MEIDIRSKGKEEVTAIRFYEKESQDDSSVAYVLKRGRGTHMYGIYDGQEDFVLVENREHAESLISALQHGIAIGWFK